MIKRGDIREDGKIFFRKNKYKDKITETWLTLEEYNKRIEYYKNYSLPYYETKKEDMRDYRFNKWAKALLFQAKHSSKIRNHSDLDIDEKWIEEKLIEQNNKCYWLGIDLITTKVKNHPQKISLDRLNCNIGYTKQNTVLSSIFANLGRKSTSEELMIDFIKTLKDSILNSYSLTNIK